MEHYPRISVVAPVYNVEDNLETFIESVLAQSFQDFELILINDGSKDNSGEICSTLSKIDSRIRVFHKSNGGVSSARNIGLDNANGEWIVFADSDDTMGNGWLELFINGAKDVDFICQGYNILLDDNVSYRNKPNENTVRLEFSEGEEADQLRGFVVKLNASGSFGYLWCKMFKANIIKKLNLRFNESYKVMEDEDFIFKYLLGIKSYRNQPEGFYNYVLPDYTSKYRSDERCIKDLWNSAKIFFKYDHELSVFAAKYGNYYLEHIASRYKQEVKFNGVNNINYFISEFYQYDFKPKNLSSKLVMLSLFKNYPNLSHIILSNIFKAIKTFKGS